MEININQHKIAIGDKYRIYIDDKEKFKASSKILKVFDEIQIVDIANEQVRLTINKKFYWFKPTYLLTLWNTKQFEFITKSFWKLHYQCNFDNDTYDIYGHTGLKYSIYKNDIQVAWWDKNSVVWFDGDNYKIIADDDCNLEMIIGFCLIVDNFSKSKDNDNTVTFDAGNIGPQARKFNPNWKPKHN